MDEIRPDFYIPRIVDRRLDELLSGLPAISLEGPRAVGKTETALRRARTVHRLDDDQQLELVHGDPSRLVEGDPPVLIDEWQRYPASWDLVRRHVDDRAKKSSFLLMGRVLRADLLDGYLDRVADYDLDEAGAGIRDRRALRRWLAAYAAATATATSFAAVRNAAAELNGRPRRALEWMTPSEAFNRTSAMTTSEHPPKTDRPNT